MGNTTARPSKNPDDCSKATVRYESAVSATERLSVLADLIGSVPTDMTVEDAKALRAGENQTEG